MHTLTIQVIGKFMKMKQNYCQGNFLKKFPKIILLFKM
jgi:hypothetical protein